MNSAPRLLCRSRKVLAVAAAIVTTACDPGTFDAPGGGRDASSSANALDPSMPAADSGAASIDAGVSPAPRDGSSPSLPGPDAAAGDAAGSEPSPGIPDDEANARDAGPDATTLIPQDASSEATPPMCSDTSSDVNNCGRCGYSCAAPNARVSCAAGECIRTCSDDFGDCNYDLLHAPMSNGCETSLDSIKNCGGCRKYCEETPDGFATCEDKRCILRTLRAEDAIPGAVYGNPSGGGGYTEPCPEGDVVTAINGAAANGSVCSIGVQCARLVVKRSAGKTTVQTSNSSVSKTWGGSCDVTSTAYSLRCPSNTVVTGIAGSLWQFGAAANTTVVRRLTLTCSSINVSADSKISLTPATTVSAGEDLPTPLSPFDAPCGPGRAVAGFSGRYGSFLDSVAASCGALVIRTKHIEAVEQQADKVTTTGQVE